MSAESHLSNAARSERFVIHGDLAPRAFRPWILRHAGRLGLQVDFVSATQDRLDLCVAGPPDLIDAMELGCSLGPRETWVDSIDRQPVSACA